MFHCARLSPGKGTVKWFKLSNCRVPTSLSSASLFTFCSCTVIVRWHINVWKFCRRTRLSQGNIFKWHLYEMLVISFKIVRKIITWIIFNNIYRQCVSILYGCDSTAHEMWRACDFWINHWTPVLVWDFHVHWSSHCQNVDLKTLWPTRLW